MKGECYLMRIRVCPQAPQCYMFPIPWNKAELIHQSHLLEGFHHRTHSCPNPVPRFCSLLMDKFTDDPKDEADPHLLSFLWEERAGNGTSDWSPYLNIFVFLFLFFMCIDVLLTSGEVRWWVVFSLLEQSYRGLWVFYSSTYTRNILPS